MNPGHFAIRVLVPLLACFGAAGTVGAEITISFPLDGWYRPGRYMPVRINGSGERGTFTLYGDGAVPTQFSVEHEGQLIIPWLAAATLIQNVHWIGPDGVSHPITRPLIALDDDQRLVATFGAGVQAPGGLFPGCRIVTVPLEAEDDPFLSPASAWDSLDALVLGAAASEYLTHDHMEMPPGTELIPAGSRQMPAPIVHGPRGMIVPEAYEPTEAWERGRPATVRHGLVLAAVIFGILAAGVTLWRSRWAGAAFAAICAVSAGVVIARSAALSPMDSLRYDVAVRDGRNTQVDSWSWNSPLRPADTRQSARGLVKPILAGVSQITADRIQLVCDSSGIPEYFQFHLDPGRTLALLSRGTEPPNDSRSLGPIDPYWRKFVDTLYVGRGERIAGQTGPDADGVATAVVAHD